MSTLEFAAKPLTARSITWSSVAPGFYVASTDGEFIGSIDTSSDGHFIALDARTGTLLWKAAPGGRSTAVP